MRFELKFVWWEFLMQFFDIYEIFTYAMPNKKNFQRQIHKLSICFVFNVVATNDNKFVIKGQYAMEAIKFLSLQRHHRE